MLEILFSIWIKKQLHGAKFDVLVCEPIGIKLILHIEFSSYDLATIFIYYLKDWVIKSEAYGELVLRELMRNQDFNSLLKGCNKKYSGHLDFLQ